jgi:hypothetical protein
MSLSRRTLPRLKKGWLVEITFLDHVCTTNGMAPPILCRAIGELINEDKDAFYLASWLTEESDHTNTEESDHTNIDSHTVLKSTIKTIELIRKNRKK